MYGPPALREGFMAQQSCYEAASLQVYPQVYPQVDVVIHRGGSSPWVQTPTHVQPVS